MERTKRKRATVRSTLTRFISKIEKELQENPQNTDQQEEFLAELKRKEVSLEKLDVRLEGYLKDEELDEELLAVDEYKERITLWKTRLERLMRSRDNPTTPTIQPGKISVTVKLPRLTIDKFYGDSSNWQSFWAQYDSSIHKNDSLGKVDKFNYLKSFMSGAAANAIAGLPLTAENYDSAVQILTARFGRRDLVINSHMNNLLSITPVKKSNDLIALRKMFDYCEVQVRSLQAMGVVSETYSTLLCPILMKVIPEDIALEFSRRRDKDEDWKVTDLLTHLRKEIESRERSQQLTKPNDGEVKGDKENKSKFERYDYKKKERVKHTGLPSAAALHMSAEINCLFCDRSDHKSEGCKERTIDEKRNILMKQRRCFVCLKRNHLARFCRSKINCSNCNRKHNRILCEELKGEAPETPPVVLTSLSHQEPSQSIMFLQTVKAVVKGTHSDMVVRCLLDSGSQRSFIKQDVSKQLKLPVMGEETIKIHTFGNNNPVTATRSRVKVFLQNVKTEKEIEIEALESPEICGALIQIPSSDITSELICQGLQVADDSSVETDCNSHLTVIIGTDYYWEVVSGNVKRLTSSLVAVDTIFGWSIHGPTAVSGSVGVCETTNAMKVITETVNPEEELASYQLRRFWELDSIGILESQEPHRDSDKEALDLFESSVKYQGNRYSVKLPWRSGSKELLSENKEVAEIRFNGLVKKFQRDPVLYTQYREVIQGYLEDGIVQKVNETESQSVVYYLPHRAVIREDKSTTKIRIVFDASSKKGNECSLNDCLYPGPNLNPELLELLIKFRENKIAFTADIEKAFLQIELSEEDRNVARFLWTENPFTDKQSMKVEVLRLTRVLFGVTSSPFLLAATIKHHLKKYQHEFPEACKLLNEALYVDDLISGAESEEIAILRTNETRNIMGKAGMCLRKWQTNSETLRDLWINQGIAPDDSVTPVIEQPTELKVLGIAWDATKDLFSFDVKQLISFLVKRTDTKRFVLQAAGRIFDPVGFLSPFIIRVKCLFQELWTDGIGWDDALPKHIWEKWDEWCKELPDLNNISIPRYYFAEAPEEIPREVQLHCFSDASAKAYGAVFYIRYESRNGIVHTAFVCSKSRVAPLKKTTLPRLELMGALLSARLSNKIKHCLRFNMKSYFWTDSTIVYFWIRGSSCRFKPFLENRISEIQTLTDSQEWFHCPGNENPADLLSRGHRIQNMVGNTLWWHGPPWLKLNPEAWPTGPVEKINTDSEPQELRKMYREITQANSAVECKPNEILELGKYSSIKRVLRTTAWVKRFLYNVRYPEKKRQGCLSAEELSLAEVYWIKVSQEKEFGTEINALRHEKTISSDSKIISLNPHLDDNGIMRVGGRLQHASIPVSQKHPVILHGKSKLVELLIQAGHERAMHGGVADTLTQVRGKFWIPRGRQIVKRTIRKCMNCKKFMSKPAVQTTAPLPKERIHETPPFQVTGVDFAGPLYTKGPKRNTTEKSYIALFTCATTRAVHLELVSDLSADKFLMAFRRFIARRGVCCTIMSDNAKTFKRAEKELKELWKRASDQKIQDFLGKEGITWKYIVPRAAWWGGFWERLVRSIKTCLKKVLGKAHLNFEEMTTLLSEVEAILNSRPLTYVYNDSTEPEPLTPAHFLAGGRLIAGPLLNIPVTISSTKTELTKRREYRKVLLKRIWFRWRTQYLLDLRSAHNLSKTKEGAELKKGDVVLVNDDNKPKILWKMGLIVDVYRGRDSKVRSCAIRLSNSTVIKRPVQLLYPLEITDDEKNSE